MGTTALVDVGEGIEKAFYAVFAIYLIGMATLAIRGFLLKRQAKSSGGIEEEMNYHFLAGSSFGPVVLFLNFCAQYIGGIVMVATPDDTRTLGYMMIMWISGCSWCGGTFNVITPRTREVMRGRNYLSPNDYLSDRYRSVWITGLGVVCSTFQMIMITGLEWKCLGDVLRAILGPTADTKTWVWLLGMFIFTCECMGGMASVALTDAIQAGLLLFSFFCMPIMCQYNWGGFEGVGGVSCENRRVADSFGPIVDINMTELNSGFGTGVNSPFFIWGTDAGYNNDDSADPGNMMSVSLVAGHPTGGVGPDANGFSSQFPFSFLKYAGKAPLPAWANTDHEFGVPSKFVKSTDKSYVEVCAYNTEQGGVYKKCPAAGTKYTAHSGLHHGFGPGKTVTERHRVVVVNCKKVDAACEKDCKEDCNYELSKWIEVNDWGNHVTSNTSFVYPGHLQFTGGNNNNSGGYTSEEHSSTQLGCVGINMPNVWHYKYPDKELVALMFSFGFLWVPFALAPVTLHRVMTAKDADALRYSLCVLHMFPISFFLPVILLGLTAGALWPDDSTSAFPLVAFNIAMGSGFGAFISTICLVACMASFMSTADSIVICGSLLFTIDMYYNLIKKGKVSMGELMIVTKMMSFFMITVGILIATETKLDFIEMLWIGNGILGALVPVYLGMFFHQLRALEVFFGMVVNIAAVMAFQFVRWWPIVDCPRCACDANGLANPGPPQLDCNPHGGTSRATVALPPPLGNGDPEELYLWFLPPFWGMLMGVPLTFAAHYALKWANAEFLHEAFDKLQAIEVDVLKKYGAERMDLDREGKIVKGFMKGCVEPMTTKEAWPFLLFPFVAGIAMPWWGYGVEPLEAVTEKGGMPTWCFNFTIINSFGTAALIVVCAFFWKGRPATAVDRKMSFGVRKSSQNVVKMQQVMPANTVPTAGPNPTKVTKAPAQAIEMQGVVPGQVIDAPEIAVEDLSVDDILAETNMLN